MSDPAEKHDVEVTTTRECSRCGDFMTSTTSLDGWALADIIANLGDEINEQFERDGCKHGECAECSIASAKDHAAEQDAESDRERIAFAL